MKGLTNKVLVALSLLSVAGPLVAGSVIGISVGHDSLVKRLFLNIQDITMDDVSKVCDDSDKWTVGVKEAIAADLNFLKSSIVYNDFVEYFKKNQPAVMPEWLNDKLKCERAVREIFNFLKPLAEQGVKIQAAGVDIPSLRESVGLEGLSKVAARKAADIAVGIDRGLEGLSEVAGISKQLLDEAKSDPWFVLQEANKYPHCREAYLAAGIDLTSLGVNEGLKGLAKVANLKEFYLEEEKNRPRFVLDMANKYSDCREEYLAAGVDLTSLGVTEGLKGLSKVAKVAEGLSKVAKMAEAKMNADINSGLNGLSDLAKTLCPSTLSERLAMKDGLVNKAQEIIRTVGVGKLALGATAIAGLGLYKLYNTETVQKWLKKKGLKK